MEIGPPPDRTVPYAQLSPTEIVPDEDSRLKAKSSISLVKSKLMAPEVVLKEDAPVMLTSVPVRPPESDFRSRIPSAPEIVILPEDDSAVMDP